MVNINKKGQALVEFILILPVLILILFGVIDLGRIFYSKIDLENKSSDIISLLKKGNTVEEVKNKLNIDSSITILVINDEDNLYRLKVYTSLDMITPGINLAIADPYKIEINRVFAYE